jgi:peptidoglycan/LPS O-acetylase OafA/YrhL
MKYRAEIDGLRALAVLPVILYHAGFKVFGGGFVGVDVFFVISGYLITNIILAELEAGTFSLIRFYERRARRILPALFLVMFVSLPFAWFWLVPDAMSQFSQSLISVSTFASNILFWRTSGYFDTAAEIKPLLHTWSLAVEEQYYVVFPLFLMLTWKLGKSWIIGLLVLVFVISLGGAQWLSKSHPSFAFYMLPTRGWELLIGAFIAFYNSRPNIKKHNHFIQQLGSFFGLLLIVYAVFTYNDKTPFPSIYTLVPTFGAALIIMFATHKTLVGRLLGSKLFVAIGLISYSAYLWHQPIFAFARERRLDEPSMYLMSVLALLSFAFAYLSWKYVERPFRDTHHISRNKVFLYGALCSAFFIGLGLVGFLSKGLTIRYADEQREFLDYYENSRPQWKYYEKINLQEKYRNQCNFYDVPKDRNGNTTIVPVGSIASECFIKNFRDNKSVLIWGDSHAQQLYSGLKKYLTNDWNILQVASSGCKAKLNAIDSNVDYCEKSNWFAYKTILDAKPEVVLIAQSDNHDYLTMRAIADNLEKIGIKKVIFTGPTPHWKPNLPTILALKLYQNIPKYTYIGINKFFLIKDQELKNQFSKINNATYLSILDVFCNVNGCLTFIGVDIKAGITTWDHGHLSPIASEYFAEKILVPSIRDGF